VLVGVTVTLAALLVGGTAFAFGTLNHLNRVLSIDEQGNELNKNALAALTVDRTAPEDPFWMLMIGTDWREDDSGVLRSDVIILARVDPAHQQAALVSIPRDTRVAIPGYGMDKINAAFAYGELERLNGDPNASGAALLIETVSNFTGIQISDYAQVSFDGLVGLVDSLGGVTVDVPFDIVGDREAGPVDVYAGPQQTLNGQEALVFCRPRKLYNDGDFQRQANQRILLQAIAKQVLAQDPLSMVNSITKICEMTTTTLSAEEIIAIANSMRGMQESDIRTYSVPSSLDMINDISYVIADETKTEQLFEALNKGEYPDYSNESNQGEVSDLYKPKEAGTAAPDNSAQTPSAVDAPSYLIAVRNGYGKAGAASAVSDMLALAGYQQGEIGNANSMVYKETLIIYRSDTDEAAAKDIRARLGYGRVIPSLDRYSFEGNILVVVGEDFTV
jgi:LCP family protein required for cell wall assembly